MTTTYVTIGVIVLIIGAIVYLYFAAKKLKNMPETPQNEKIVTLTTANFSNQTKNGLVLIDFWASWCMPCKVIGPILNEIADEIGDTARIAKVNVEEQQQLAAQFGVRNIPTLVLMKNGKEINRFVGVKPKAFLISQLKNA